jgi:hypothetical protein
MENSDRKFYLARYWSNEELRKVAPLFTGDIVNVSAGDNLDKEGNSYDSYFTNKRNYYMTNYGPGTFRGFQGLENEFNVDLSKIVPKELEKRFDVVYNHTVLEHIFDVRTAFKNLCNLSKDIVIVIVPFAQEQHDVEDYGDYWRFCPSGLRFLYQENGLEVIYESYTDGVNSAIYLFFIGSRYPEKWRNKLPPYQLITKVGSWIGNSSPPFLLILIDRLKLVIRRYISGNVSN